MGEQASLVDFLYDSPQNSTDSVRGGELWEAFSRQKQYYLYHEECALINACASRLGPLLRAVETFVDLGPGSGLAVRKKTIGLLSELCSILTYAPIDVSESFIQSSISAVSKFDPKMNIQPIIGNYSQDLKLENHKNVLVFFGGGSIGNMEISSNIAQCPLSHFLYMIYHNLSFNSYVLITQDTTHNALKLREAYALNPKKQFLLNVFYRIQRDLHLPHFDPTAFRYLAEWNSDIYAVEMWGIATKRQVICIAEKEYIIEKDFPVPIARSYKLPPDMFLQKTHQAGFEHLQSFNTRGSGVYLHLLKKTPAVSLSKKVTQAA